MLIFPTAEAQTALDSLDSVAHMSNIKLSEVDSSFNAFNQSIEENVDQVNEKIANLNIDSVKQNWFSPLNSWTENSKSV